MTANRPTQVCFLHLVPGERTGEFAQPTAMAARGFAWTPLNRLSWWLADRMVLQGLYHKLAVEVGSGFGGFDLK